MSTSIQIVEVGARDGLQNEPDIVSTSDKLALLNRLIDAGAKRLEIASFVHPGRVPQMADAEAVIAGMPDLPLPAPLHRLVAVGGGTQGGLWTQIVSDVTGREQVVPAQTIGARQFRLAKGGCRADRVPTDGTNLLRTPTRPLRCVRLRAGARRPDRRLVPGEADLRHRPTLPAGLSERSLARRT